jgi:hypothetical protein
VNMASAETSWVGGELGEVDRHEAAKRAETARHGQGKLIRSVMNVMMDQLRRLCREEWQAPILDQRSSLITPKR